MRKKKVFIAGTMFLLSASMLSGCSIEIGKNSKKPETAADVVANWQKNDNTNYSMDGTITAGIDISAEGVSMSIPIDLGIKGDVAGQYSHLNVSMDMEVMGQQTNVKAETYMDFDEENPIVYMQETQDGETSDWTYSEVTENKDKLTMLTSQNIDTSLFDDSKMSYDKDSDTYTVTQPVSSILESDSFKEFMGDTDSLDDAVSSINDDIDADDVLEAFGKASVVYVFDSDFNLESLKSEDLVYSTTFESDGQELELSITIDIDFDFSDFGKIESDDVQASKDIKKNAVEASDESIIEDIDDSIIDETDDSTDSSSDITNDTDAEDTSESDAWTGTEPSQSLVTSDVMSYNGVSLSYKNNSFDSIFGADGWQLDINDDGEYSFCTAENAKYPDAILFVYQSDRGSNNSTIAGISSSGFSGFELDFGSCTGSERPNVSIDGVTFASTTDNVKAILGEPSYQSISTDSWGEYTYYTYDSDDRSFEFSFVDGVLTSIEMYVYE
jgi:hypothetical protein